MAKIKQILAREILNGKGEPTIETTVVLSDGKIGISSVPSDFSTGNYESVQLLDSDKSRFQGKGMLKAIQNVQNVIAPALLGLDATKQQEIDKKMIELDGTQNKQSLGANAIFSVSTAVCEAASRSSVLPFYLYLREFIKKDLPPKIPTPIFNFIGGGKEIGINFQEFLAIPASSKTYSQTLIAANNIRDSLKNLLKTNNLSTLVSDKGGFGPNLSNNEDGLSFLKQSIDSSNLKLGFDVFLGIDCAANSFFHEQKYQIKDRSMSLSSSDLLAFYQELNKKFQLLYIEDPFWEEDWDSWAQITELSSQQSLIVGDDLTSTNPYRLQIALNKKALTGIVIKPSQIGTVIEALAVVEIARQAGLKIIVSTRSSETDDDFIADFAVATSADYIKFGGLTRGEFISKYNRLLQIESQIKKL